jgi:hypothetical protein
MRKRAPAVRAPLEEKVKLHDRHQFELKLEYQPSGAERESNYAVEAYVCLPASLHITAQTLPTQEIYSDIHNYVRLKTPELTWPELLAVPDSPLVRLGEALPGGNAEEIIHLCKLVASVFRTSLRDVASAVARDPREEGVRGQIMAALDGAERAAAEYRELGERIAALPEGVRAAYGLADEHMSLSAEQMFRRMLLALPERDPLRKGLLQRILAEEHFRKQRGYPSIIDPQSRNEEFIHRAGVLKKYCSSVLFLRVHQAQPRLAQEILFAIAAGVSMALATVFALWAQSRYGSVGLNVFLIIVVAYMFRERIKEGTKGAVARLLKRYHYDRRCTIDDPSGVEVGTFREKVEYLSKVPREVARLRRSGVEPMLARAQTGLVEVIYRYRKMISLESRRVPHGLTDILRFHVGRLLRDMDEPDQEIGYVAIDGEAVASVQASKTYHVDVVFQFHSGREPKPRTLLARLILDRNGIRRIEQAEE